MKKDYTEQRARKSAMAKSNIRRSTRAEAALWSYLNQWKTGYRAARQYNIRGFLVDFAFPALKVVVEVDGGYHFTTHQQAEDSRRQSVIESSGWQVIRFTNDQVMTETRMVMQNLLELLDDQATKANVEPRMKKGNSPCGRA